MSRLFEKGWVYYDTHFVVQIAGCPFDCPYCYVDNLKIDTYTSAKEIVNKFFEFSETVPNLNVIHLCGGAPARYSQFWEELRVELDNNGLSRVVILSDTIFVENHLYKVKPWNYLHLHHFCLVGCLKGVTPLNFFLNASKRLFHEAIAELTHYVNHKNFWLTLINYDVTGLSNIFDLVPYEKIDFLKVVEYEVVKRRKINDLS